MRPARAIFLQAEFFERLVDVAKMNVERAELLDLPRRQATGDLGLGSEIFL